MDFLLVSEAAKRLRIHPNTLRDLENRGMIQVRRNWAGWRIYTESDLKALEEKLFPREKSEAK